MPVHRKVKPHIKKAWVEALRSGKYKQGKGYLRSVDNKYCCLGVLCDLGDYSKENWIRISSYYYYDKHTCFPSAKIMDEVNINQYSVNRLISMNDSNSSFKEIADWIEEKL